MPPFNKSPNHPILMTEVWQRGPVANIPPLLQPVAHTLLQAREEVQALIALLDDDKLWNRPAGVASPAFHLKHLSGVLDRLFTYARAESLSQHQLKQLADEALSYDSQVNIAALLERFHAQVDVAIQQLTQTQEQTLTDYRPVGRQQLPSTVIGLLFHAAEHTMRHVGQLRVTVKIIMNDEL